MIKAGYLRIVLLLLLIWTIAAGAEVLDLAKKSVYDLGSGEELELQLDFPKGGQYEFYAAQKGAFALKKISATRMVITFSAAKLTARPAAKETYQAYFSFIKTNTGRKSTLTVRASYIPPISQSQPAAAAATAPAPTVASAQSAVQQSSAAMQQAASQAQQVAQSAGLTSQQPSAPAVAVPETIRVTVPAAAAPASTPWFLLIVIAILTIITIILLIKQLIPKAPPVSTKYEDFYKDVATILDINIKGRSIDGTADDLIHALMDLVQKKDNPVALFRSKDGLEKRSISVASQASGTDDDFNLTESAVENKQAMSSRFIDPSLNKAGAAAANNNFSDSRVLNAADKTVSRAEDFSYQNPHDYLSEPSTLEVDQGMMNKIYREVKKEETPQEMESIEEKRKKIEEMLGRKKF